MIDYKGSIEYRGKKYDLVFNLNVMEAIQVKYGSVDKWGELTDKDEPDAAALKFGVMHMLNEGIDIQNEETGAQTPFFTLKQVGRLISEIGADTAAKAMQETVIVSTQSDEKNA